MNKIMKKECFFYGLYMDPKILKKAGVSVSLVRNAVLNNFKLDLKGAAKVIPSAGDSVWGTLIKLSDSEVTLLYSGEATCKYQREIYEVTTEEEENIKAICYNIPENFQEKINQTYLGQLIDSAKRMSLPNHYIEYLKDMQEIV